MAMAAATPWTITSTKRKTPISTNVQNSRKRQKLTSTEKTAIRKQQTLTQIQWVPSSRPTSFEDVSDLEYISPNNVEAGNVGSPGTARKKSERKPMLFERKSTLTQMDFFGLHNTGLGDDLGDGHFIAQEKVHAGKGTHHGGKHSVETEPAALPQLDGHWASPRKKRQKLKSDNEGTYNGTAGRSEVGALAGDDYRPKKKIRKTTAQSASAHRRGSRRPSDRIKNKVLSDPDQNLQYFSKALAIDGELTPAVPARSTVQPKLEIQDTMEGGEDLEISRPVSQLWQHRPTPKTPRRYREVIPSSQSPESLPPSTKSKKMINLTTPRRRAPLREMSANTPTLRSRLADSGGLSLQSTISPSPKRKICILKLPQKSHQNRKSCIEDSQADVFSIQATSSPRPEKSVPAFVDQPLVADVRQESGQEIAETDHSQLDHDQSVSSSPPQEESLESLTALFGTARRRDDASSDLSCTNSGQRILEKSEVIVRDFAISEEEQATPKPSTSLNDARLEPLPVVEVEKADDEDDDDVSTFGTPIANDTQFNAELVNHLPSSPIYRSIHGSTRIRGSGNCEDRASHIQALSRDNQGNQEDTEPFVLPPPSLVCRTTLATIPLNDLPQPFSSSPNLPPMRTHRSQRSIHPASLPHQSQISTQDPTQQFLPMSSLPPYHQPQPNQNVDRITIKDSSSIQMQLSQVPTQGEELSQLNIDLGLHDDEHGDDEEADLDHGFDLDLDPSSAPPAGRRLFPRSPESQRQLDEFRHKDPERHLPSSSQLQQHQSPTRDNSSTDGHHYHPDTTQANFTQGGHVTAARIARMRAQGLIPDFMADEDIPSFQVPPARELLESWCFEGLDDVADGGGEEDENGLGDEMDYDLDVVMMGEQMHEDEEEMEDERLGEVEETADTGQQNTRRRLWNR